MDDHAQSIFAFARFDRSGTPVLAICNMTPTPHTHYRVGVPNTGSWHILLNTDDIQYGGSSLTAPHISSENKAVHGYQQSILLDLPPLSTMILGLANH